MEEWPAILRVAVNIFNNQSQSADSGWGVLQMGGGGGTNNCPP